MSQIEHIQDMVTYQLAQFFSPEFATNEKWIRSKRTDKNPRIYLMLIKFDTITIISTHSCKVLDLSQEYFCNRMKLY